MDILMSIGKALTMAVAAASMLGLTDSENDRLRSYVNLHAKQWVAAQKRESEVEAMIKSEASRISKGG